MSTLDIKNTNLQVNSSSRNGSTRKTLKTEDGQFQLDTPRSREGSFEPKLVKKSQTR
jgi:transposase-like protein